MSGSYDFIRVSDVNRVRWVEFSRAPVNAFNRQMVEEAPLELMLRHLDHLMGILGEDRVGMGSDFDGAIVPAEIGDLAGLPKLRTAMRAHGYDDALMEKLFWSNWMALLRRVWRQ